VVTQSCGLLENIENAVKLFTHNSSIQMHLLAPLCCTFKGRMD
jgi:hypothetical protein